LLNIFQGDVRTNLPSLLQPIAGALVKTAVEGDGWPPRFRHLMKEFWNSKRNLSAEED
jgi:hypothetical protein